MLFAHDSEVICAVLTFNTHSKVITKTSIPAQASPELSSQEDKFMTNLDSLVHGIAREL